MWLELHIQQQNTLFGYLVICLTCWKIRLKPIDVFWNLISCWCVLETILEQKPEHWNWFFLQGCCPKELKKGNVPEWTHAKCLVVQSCCSGSLCISLREADYRSDPSGPIWGISVLKHTAGTGELEPRWRPTHTAVIAYMTECAERRPYICIWFALHPLQAGWETVP